MTSLPINDLLRRFPRLSDIEDDVRHSFSIPERTYYPVPSSQIWTERNVRMPELDMLPFHIRDELKKQLGVVNEAKNKFDSIPELKDAEHVVRVFDFYGGLKNYLQNVKSAQIVTNAWLKCYEMLQDYNLTAVAEMDNAPSVYSTMRSCREHSSVRRTTTAPITTYRLTGSPVVISPKRDTRCWVTSTGCTQTTETVGSWMPI